MIVTRRNSRRPRFGLLVSLLAGTLATTAPALATPGSLVGTPMPISTAPADLVRTAAADTHVSASRPSRRMYFVFHKNRQDPTNSRLIMYGATLYPDRAPRFIKLRTWRAGSGVGGNAAGQDPCAKENGWLPNGAYDGHRDGPAHDKNFSGTLIFGIVWRLEDKRCKRGTLRNELFIHSEMTPEGGQACGQREDQCWDGPGDYKSAGCIKLSPKDIKTAARLARSWGGPADGQRNYEFLLVVTG